MCLKMQLGTVEMVPVEWIMQNAQHSVDGFEGVGGSLDFLELMLKKGADSGFERLLNTIASIGFRVPIVLLPYYYDYGLTLGNGHHRITAAILLHLDSIPVYWAEHDYMSEAYSDTEIVNAGAGDFAGIMEKVYS